MSMTSFQKFVLALAGFIALAIGSSITLIPQAFYASYGIVLGSDPNMLSELRAPGANLAFLGGVMLAGLFKPAWTSTAVTVAFAVFLAFPLGRIVGIVFDGIPSNSVLGALLIEVFLALVLVLAFRRGRKMAPELGQVT